MSKGVIYGLLAYLMWGFFPIYFKSLHAVPALEIVFHRVVWSFVFLAILTLVRGEWKTILALAANRKTVLIYTIAAVLLAANWLVYVYGVNTEQVVETSLGYFINPLVSVALGVILLRERLRPLQWLPVGLAAAGVIYLTVQYGSLPWIALLLAFTFGLYGLIKKIAPLGSLYGLMLETALLFLPALAYLGLAEAQGTGTFAHSGWQLTLLLIISGVVTSAPLLLFASAARSIPLSLVGILQYVAPTVQFLLGVLVFREPFSPTQMVGFGFVWLALAIFTIEGLVAHGREKQVSPLVKYP